MSRRTGAAELPQQPNDPCGSESSGISSHPIANGFPEEALDIGPVSALPDPAVGRSNNLDIGMISQSLTDVPRLDQVDLTSRPSDGKERKCSCLRCQGTWQVFRYHGTWQVKYLCSDEKCKVPPNKVGDDVHYHCPEQCKIIVSR